MSGWLGRLAAKLTRKVEPSAVAMGADNSPTPVTAAAAEEIKKEQAEQTK